MPVTIVSNPDRLLAEWSHAGRWDLGNQTMIDKHFLQELHLHVIGRLSMFTVCAAAANRATRLLGAAKGA